ncbi:MAG: presenilin family intramembrane aspartyl protease [Dehalococcoidales bacterium]|nr:presenilin family intramembrane aspartyl protease [Dehalococcoidales bacterium]
MSPDEVMKAKISPFFWSGIVLVMAQSLTLHVAFREKLYLEANQISSPDISLGPVLVYFFGVVVLLGLVLFFLPVNKLRVVFRVAFAVMLGWGAFISTVFTLPGYLPYAAAAAAAIIWFFWARIWLHNLLFVGALAGAGAMFGFLFSPWTFMIFMLIVAVYDVLAVRFGYMMWMAGRFSDFDAMPAFVFPRRLADWNRSLDEVRLSELATQESVQRDFSILGGGDIGFPLMLSVSVFFAAGLPGAIIVGLFALAGLMGAFLIQLLWLKDKPMPALSPIALTCLAGLLIAT